MNESKSVDYFSSLPPELLEDILGLAHDPDPYWRSSVRLGSSPSRYLRPFFDRVLYSQVVLNSLLSLDRFCRQTGQDALAQVRSLAIEIPWKERSDFGFDPNFVEEEEDEDCDSPTNEDVAQTLRLTHSLRELDITGSTRLSLLILSSIVASSSLPNLRSLSLTSTFHDLFDPFHPSHYSVIPFYPLITSLRLTIVRRRHSIYSGGTNDALLSYSPFHSLARLDLTGPMLASSHLPNILTSLFNLSGLYLEDSEGDSRLLDALQLLPNTEKLEDLTVVMYKCVGRPSTPARPVSLSFERFSNLRSIAIVGRVDLDIFSSCRELGSLSSLANVSFGRETVLSTSGLSQLIDSVTLKTLAINHLEAQSSLDEPWFWQIMVDSSDEEDFENLPIQISRPQWTDEFSREGFRKLVEKCNEKGIKITGSTLKALNLEDRFDRGDLERERIRRLEEKKNCEGGAR